jgi:uncharacterized protein YihD (DUF1040 family)
MKKQEYKMTREEIFRLYQSMKELSTQTCDIKFAYTLIKNAQLLRSEVEIITEMIKPPERMKEYEQKRIEICRKYCILTGNKQPKVDENNNFVFHTPEMQKKAEDTILEMRKDYEEDIKKAANRETELIEFLKEEVSIDLIKVPIEVFPNTLTPTQMESLMPMVDENKVIEKDQKLKLVKEK